MSLVKSLQRIRSTQMGLVLVFSLQAVALAVEDEKTPIAVAKAQMERILEQVEIFASECGYWPELLDELIISKVCSTRKIPYLKSSEIMDPWKIPFAYIKNGNEIQLRSLGADGKEGGSGPMMDLIKSRTIR